MKTGTFKSRPTERETNSIIKKVGGFYETMMNKEGVEEDFKTLEGVLSEDIKTLPQFIDKIHSPEVIKSFILEQMDRLPPTTQHICKCAALVGTYFSRQIIMSINSSIKPTKINQAFRELIEAQIIEPISSLFESYAQNTATLDMKKKSEEQDHLEIENDKFNNERRGSFITDKIEYKKGFDCDHLRFKNNFYRECIDQLWLNQHRNDLHSLSSKPCSQS